MPGSVSTPYGIAWLAGRLYVPGRTSNNIGVVDGDKLSQVIALDGMPTQIVADEQLGRLYVVTNNQQAVAMVEASQVRATITVTNPRIANYQRVLSLALDAPHQRLYAAVEADMAGIAIIDTRSFTITRWLEIPGDHFWTRIVLDPSGTTLYVASSNKIEALDVDTGRVVQTTALQSSTYGVFTLDPTTGRLFVDQSDGGSLVVAIENGHIVARVPVGDEPHEGLVIGRRLYITSSYSNTVSVIDLDSLNTLATIPVGLSPRALAADPSGASLYVAAGDNFARVAVVDTRTNTVTKLIPLVAQPSQLIADETRKRLYALMPSSNEVLVSDGQRVLSSIPLELAPGQMALDETTGRLYVTDRITSRLSIIDVASGRLIERRALTVPTPLSSIAVDASNRRLFVNNDAFALDDLAPQGTYTITMYMYPDEPNLVPYRLIAEPSGQRLYAIAPNGAPGSNGGVVAYAVDSNKLRVQSEFGEINVFALAIDAGSQRAYVAASHPIEGLGQGYVYRHRELHLQRRATHAISGDRAGAESAHPSPVRCTHNQRCAAACGSSRCTGRAHAGNRHHASPGRRSSEMAILGDRVYIAHKFRAGRCRSSAIAPATRRLRRPSRQRQSRLCDVDAASLADSDVNAAAGCRSGRHSHTGRRVSRLGGSLGANAGQPDVRPARQPRLARSSRRAPPNARARTSRTASRTRAPIRARSMSSRRPAHGKRTRTHGMRHNPKAALSVRLVPICARQSAALARSGAKGSAAHPPKSDGRSTRSERCPARFRTSSGGLRYAMMPAPCGCCSRTALGARPFPIPDLSSDVQAERDTVTFADLVRERACCIILPTRSCDECDQTQRTNQRRRATDR